MAPVDREQPTAPPPGRLEDQLRNMILSNVTISKDGSNQQPAHPSFHQRGRGYMGQDSPSRNQPRHDESFSASGHNVRGGRGGRGRGRGRGGFTHRRGGPQGPESPYQFSNEVQSAHQSHFEDQEAMRPDLLSAKGSQTQWHQHQHQRHHSRNQQPSIEHFPSLRTSPQAPHILKRPHNGQMPSQHIVNPTAGQAFPRHQYHHFQAPSHEDWTAQIQFLDSIAQEQIPQVEIASEELGEKEAFRSHLENICRGALTEGFSSDTTTISLVGFGSLSSGFATSGSDMDLAIVPRRNDASKVLDHSSQIDRNIPRLLEKALLSKGIGSRLLTRTRVPILKVCQSPSKELYEALSEERRKWDELPEAEKYPLPDAPHASIPPQQTLVEVDGQSKPVEVLDHNNVHSPRWSNDPVPSQLSKPPSSPKSASTTSQDTAAHSSSRKDKEPRQQLQIQPERPWLRERALGPLDFPKQGIGIQCDINFANALALHNTHLLRCYSLCDPRVRPIVLFVKAWAKRRKINSSYSGTLSSYGYVLMVLHYLVNVAQPPVCPNLQLYGQSIEESVIDGYTVRFWRSESEISAKASAGMLTHNTQTVGGLLRGFFQYYSSLTGPRNPAFIWTTEVLSLRSEGGILTKQEKGWTGAKTTNVKGKEVRHRYLFAIEDPFEWDHNVARTVTHNGIVAIRDEFRRAWRILMAVGRGVNHEGGLFDEVIEKTLSTPPTPKDETKSNARTVEDVEAEPNADEISARAR